MSFVSLSVTGVAGPVDERGDEHEPDERRNRHGNADPDPELDAAREHEAGVLGRSLEVREGIAPGPAELSRSAAALLAKILLDGIHQVVAADSAAVIRRVDERRHVEYVLEAFRVEGARVALAGVVEAFEGGAGVTAVDRGAGLAEVAVRTGGHAGDKRYPFRHGPDTHACELPGYVRDMDEARAVLRRLSRIEALEREGGPPRALLAEVHELLAEAEAWTAAERGGVELAAAALERCRDALAEPAALR